MSRSHQTSPLGLISLIRLLRGVSNSPLSNPHTHTTKVDHPIAHPGTTAMRACGVSSEGILVGMGSEMLRGTTSQTLIGITSLKDHGTINMSHRPGVVPSGSRPSGCSDLPTSVGPSHPTSSTHSSTSLHIPTTSTASRPASCRMTSPLATLLSGHPTLTALTIPRETSLQTWDPLITTLATACHTLGSMSTRLGLGPSTLTLALLPTASMASPPTCGDRAHLTSTMMTPAWSPMCPTSIFQRG